MIEVGSPQEEVISGEERVDSLLRENEQLRKEIQDLLIIGEVARSITGSLLIEDVLGAILRGIKDTLGFECVVLGLVNSESRFEEVKLVVGSDAPELRKARWAISEEDRVWRQLLTDPAPIVVSSYESHDLPGFVTSVFPTEFVKAPMIVKGEIIGSIMTSTSARPISTRDIRLLAILVEFAGIAIENGRLYYDVIRADNELKKTQDQLVEAERLAAIGQLAVSINHEINNPLCTINMSSQLLRLELESRAPDLIARLDGIEQAVQRIVEVTQKVSRMKQLRSTEYLANQMMIDLK